MCPKIPLRLKLVLTQPMTNDALEKVKSKCELIKLK